MDDSSSKPSLLWLVSALLCRCPSCGEGLLFKSMLEFHHVCPNCGLNLSKREQGDGSAYIAMCVIGTLAVTGVVLMELFFSPPLWLQAVIWIPAILVGSVIALRVSKSLMTAFQFHYKPEDFT